LATGRTSLADGLAARDPYLVTAVFLGLVHGGVGGLELIECFIN